MFVIFTPGDHESKQNLRLSRIMASFVKTQLLRFGGELLLLFDFEGHELFEAIWVNFISAYTIFEFPRLHS